jgi:hypothetical protein
MEFRDLLTHRRMVRHKLQDGEEIAWPGFRSGTSMGCGAHAHPPRRIDEGLAAGVYGIFGDTDAR